MSFRNFSKSQYLSGVRETLGKKSQMRYWAVHFHETYYFFLGNPSTP